MAPKNLYSVLHTAYLVFNPGNRNQAGLELREILENLFLRTKYLPEIHDHATCELELRSLSFYSLVELLMRGQIFQDIRLQLACENLYYESSFRKFCDGISWDQFLIPGSTIDLRVQSIGSRLYHESMLKEMLEKHLRTKFGINLESKEDESLTKVYIDLNNNVGRASLSLAGRPLYQRGFRELGGAVAPLREDIAQGCLREALVFCRSQREDYHWETLWVPFGGTGTFVFETIMNDFKMAPCLFRPSYALEKMPFFNEKNFAFVQKKARAQIHQTKLKNLLYSDYSEEVCELFRRNYTNFEKSLKSNGIDNLLTSIQLRVSNENFFLEKFDGFQTKNVFVPLNPPYGLRLHSNLEIPGLYRKIAKKLLDVANAAPSCTFGGFILCPSEESWSAFVRTIESRSKVESYHLSQGGLDIRVCQFLLN